MITGRCLVEYSSSSESEVDNKPYEWKEKDKNSTQLFRVSAETNFFNLISDSSEDVVEEEDSLNKYPEDTLINAYQLSDNNIGPLQNEDKESKFKRRTRKKYPPKCNKWQKIDREAQINFNTNCDESPIVSGSLTHVLKKGTAINPSANCKLPRKIISELISKNGKKAHNGCINNVSWGINSSSHLLLSCSMDGVTAIWNALGNEDNCVLAKKFHGGSAVRCAKYSASGMRIASGGYDKTVQVIDCAKGVSVRHYEHDNFVTSVIYHPTEEQILLSGSMNCVYAWDTRLDGTKPIKSYEANFNEVQDLVFLPDEQSFLIATNIVTRDSADKTIMAWDFSTSAILSNQIYQERYHCCSLCIHPYGKHFVAQSNGDYIALFSTARPYKMNKNKRYEGHSVKGYWIGCDFSKDGKWLASGSADGKLYFYNFWKGKEPVSVLGSSINSVPCVDVRWHPLFPSVVAAGYWDGSIKIYS